MAETIMNPASFPNQSSNAQYYPSGSPMSGAGFLSAVNSNINASNQNAIVSGGLTSQELANQIAQQQALQAQATTPAVEQEQALAANKAAATNALYGPNADGSPSMGQSAATAAMGAGITSSLASQGKSEDTIQAQKVEGVDRVYQSLKPYIRPDGTLNPMDGNTQVAAKAADKALAQIGFGDSGSVLDPSVLTHLATISNAAPNTIAQRQGMQLGAQQVAGKIEQGQLAYQRGVDVGNLRLQQGAAADQARRDVANIQAGAVKSSQAAAGDSVRVMLESAEAHGGQPTPAAYSNAINRYSDAYYNDPDTGIGKFKAIAEQTGDSAKLADLKAQAHTMAVSTINQALADDKAGRQLAIPYLTTPASAAAPSTSTKPASTPTATPAPAAIPAAPQSTSTGRATLTNDAAGKAAWAAAKSGTPFTTADGRNVTKP